MHQTTASNDTNTEASANTVADRFPRPAALADLRVTPRLLWAAASCLLLSIAGFGPQANVTTFNLGELGSGTITAAYVVSGTVYVLAAVLAGVGLAVSQASTEPSPRALKVALWAGVATVLAAAFSLIQISATTQVVPVATGWGLKLALAASISLVAATGGLVRRASRKQAR